MDAARVWELNHRLITQSLDRCAERMEALGVEPKEFFVLAEIEELRYPAAIAKRIVVPKATLTTYLKSLEAKGLVGREIDPGDLRRHRLALTPRGAEVLAEVRAVLAETFEQSLSQLDATERSALETVLTKLVDDAT
jgi:DNA-binding MarR family transcriptional regulator